MRIRANYYQQFDADFSLKYPVEGYEGWKTTELEIDPAHTALVVMHAWDLGERDEFPGQFRCCYEVQSTYRVCREVFPPLLGAVRQSPLTLFHVVSGRGYYEQYPGWAKTQALLPDPPPPLPRIGSDPVYDALNRFRHDRVFPGAHNQADCSAAWAQVAFPKEAEPLGDEGIAADQHQLFALCQDAGINHLIYAGFNIDWCLLMSPGGMVDMSRYGIICSAVRDGVTAVENAETIRDGVGKEISLWRVSVGFGFVFDSADIIAAISAGE
jgi:hypothetical protein